MKLENLTGTKYIHTSDVHNLKAPSVIVPYLIQLFHPKSVVDVGCGLATFLAVFKENGVSDVLGIDGNWVEKGKLFVDQSEFKEADLEKEFRLQRNFDMVLCLEVAEHLKEESADIIVGNLVSLGNVIVFSAAVPNQGGQNHLNEQSFSYWQKKFKKHSYSFYDIFREKFWNESDIDWWYKQNMFLIAHDSINLPEVVLKNKVEGEPLLFIHPDTLATRISQLKTMTEQAENMRAGNASVSFYLKGMKGKLFNSFKRVFGIKK